MSLVAVEASNSCGDYIALQLRFVDFDLHRDAITMQEYAQYIVHRSLSCTH